MHRRPILSKYIQPYYFGKFELTFWREKFCSMTFSRTVTDAAKVYLRSSGMYRVFPNRADVPDIRLFWYRLEVNVATRSATKLRIRLFHSRVVSVQ